MKVRSFPLSRSFALLVIGMTIGLSTHFRDGDIAKQADEPIIQIGIQSAKADNSHWWNCTCQLYSDANKKKRVGQWRGKVDGPAGKGMRWFVEKFLANEACENETEGVDCKKCGCSE